MKPLLFVCICLSCLAPALQAQDLNQGLLAYYQFTNDSVENSGQALTYRLSGGTALRPGKHGNALQLDGQPYSTLKAKGIDLYNEFTIAFWVKPSKLPGGTYQPVFSQYNKQKGRLFTFGLLGNQLALEINDGRGAQNRRVLQRRVAANEWTFVAFTIDRCGQVKAFEGCSMETETVTFYIREPLRADELRIGTDHLGNAFTGMIDELMVFDRPLPEDDVKAMLCRGQLPETKPVSSTDIDRTIAQGLGIPPSFAPTPGQEERPVVPQGTYVVHCPEVTISFWDAQREDGDTVSVFINGVEVLHQTRLTKKQIAKTIVLKPHDNNYIISHAHNTGGIWPNTAGIIINDGSGTPQQLEINSDIGSSGAINLVYEPKPGGCQPVNANNSNNQNNPENSTTTPGTASSALMEETIRGRVIMKTRDQKPAGGITVYMENQPQYTTTTRADGTFALPVRYAQGTEQINIAIQRQDIVPVSQTVFVPLHQDEKVSFVIYE